MLILVKCPDLDKSIYYVRLFDTDNPKMVIVDEIVPMHEMKFFIESCKEKYGKQIITVDYWCGIKVL